MMFWRILLPVDEVLIPLLLDLHRTLLSLLYLQLECMLFYLSKNIIKLDDNAHIVRVFIIFLLSLLGEYIYGIVIHENLVQLSNTVKGI